MTKLDLQKELLEKVKPGTKPSHLKKSKSTGDLPAANLPAEQPRRKSIDLLSNPDSLKKKLTKAQDQISILELKLETQERELTELNNLSAENSHLKEQLKETNSKLVQTQTELDNSLQARHQSLKDFGSEHEKRVKIQTELDNMAEESAEELTKNDQTITSLKSQLFQANQQINNLQQDLTLVQKLAESRKVPYFENEFNGLSYFKYFVYSLIAVGFILVLMRKREVNNV
jgi:chromosome segregation ATPase